MADRQKKSGRSAIHGMSRDDKKSGKSTMTGRLAEMRAAGKFKRRRK